MQFDGPHGQLASFGIDELAANLEQRAVSCVEVCTAALERIDFANRALNAFTVVAADAALEQAHQLDREVAEGRIRGPLHGVPIAVKDAFETEGMPTTAGSYALRSHVPSSDAAWVRWLREAGAIIIGKTNLDEFCYGVLSRNACFGPTRNPYAPEYVPGGSSGGSAVAVGAGLAVGALGTDTGGSLRIPASFCGCVAYKPDRAESNLDGVIPLSRSFDVAGPIARSVADVRRLMSVARQGMFPERPGDHEAHGPSSGRNRDELGLRPGLRFGMLDGFFMEGVEDEVRDALAKAGAQLEAAGANVVAVEVPGVEVSETLAAAMVPETYVGINRYLERAIGAQVPDVLENLGADLRRLLGRELPDSSKKVPATRYLTLTTDSMTVVRKGFESVLEQHDYLLAPITPIGPVDVNSDGTVVSADGSKQSVFATYVRNCFCTNVADVPAVALPAGIWKSPPTPFGLQIIGRRGSTAELLQVAEAIESMLAPRTVPQWHD